MKSNIKKILGIVLSIGVFMYIFSGIVFADSAPLDFGSFQDINSTGGNNTAVVSQNNTITNNNVETNKTTNTTNKTNTVVSQDSTTLPKTGSNNEVIFIIGITILVGTTVFIYNKTKIKLIRLHKRNKFKQYTNLLKFISFFIYFFQKRVQFL